MGTLLGAPGSSLFRNILLGLVKLDNNSVGTLMGALGNSLI